MSNSKTFNLLVRLFPDDFNMLSLAVFYILRLHLEQKIIKSKNHIENEIIRLLQSGDKQGISLAYKIYGNSLLGLIFKVVQSKEASEEVLQDTFVKIWKYAAQYDASKGRLFTWFANIARNTAIDKVRSAGFQRDQKTDSISSFVSKDKLATSEMKIVDSGLKEVIDSLDEKYRKLIELVYFQGYSQREIEKEFDIPLGTIKTRLRTAIGELRSKLSKDYADRLLVLLITLENFIN